MVSWLALRLSLTRPRPAQTLEELHAQMYVLTPYHVLVHHLLADGVSMAANVISQPPRPLLSSDALSNATMNQIGDPSDLFVVHREFQMLVQSKCARLQELGLCVTLSAMIAFRFLKNLAYTQYKIKKVRQVEYFLLEVLREADRYQKLDELPSLLLGAIKLCGILCNAQDTNSREAQYKELTTLYDKFSKFCKSRGIQAPSHSSVATRTVPKPGSSYAASTFSVASSRLSVNAGATPSPTEIMKRWMAMQPPSNSPPQSPQELL